MKYLKKMIHTEMFCLKQLPSTGDFQLWIKCNGWLFVFGASFPKSQIWKLLLWWATKIDVDVIFYFFSGHPSISNLS